MRTKSSCWMITTTLLVTCVLSYKAFAAPLDSDKSGEEQVKDAVRKAEAAASLAAENSDKRETKDDAKIAEEKINKLAAEIEDNSSMKEGRAAKKVNLLMHHVPHSTNNEDGDSNHNTMRVKEHRVHRKPGLSHLMGITGLGDIGNSNSASYKEDTKLEDRLALEAEEEKKYEDGYGGSQWDDGPTGGTKGGSSWSTNIQRQDAAEKQSIQAQVASESAHELNEIQQAVAAEAQSSRGSATMGDQGASVVQLSHNEDQGARFREESGPRPIEAGASYEAPRIKSFDSSNRMNNDLSSILRQSAKLSPSELQGPPKQFSSESLRGLSNFGGQGLSRFSQGSQESQLPMESQMSNSFAGSEGNQYGGASMQEVEPSQKEAFTGGALQGASMEGGSMHGGAIDMGGNNMQSMGPLSTAGMGPLSTAGFTGEQQQPLVAGMQGMMGGGGMQTLGAAGANSMGAMQPFANMGASMGGLQSFGGAAGGMTFKKRSKTAKVEKDHHDKSSDKKEKNNKKSKLTRHHHRHHHHQRNN